jgi:hypothetical protein
MEKTSQILFLAHSRYCEISDLYRRLSGSGLLPCLSPVLSLSVLTILSSFSINQPGAVDPAYGALTNSWPMIET